MDLGNKPDIEQNLWGSGGEEDQICGVEGLLGKKTNDLHLNLESTACYYYFSGLRLELLMFAEETTLGSSTVQVMLYKPARDLNFFWTIYIFASFCLHHLASHLPIMAS